MKMTYRDALAVSMMCGGLELIGVGLLFNILPMLFIGLPMVFACVTGFALNRVEEERIGEMVE